MRLVGCGGSKYPRAKGTSNRAFHQTLTCASDSYIRKFRSPESNHQGRSLDESSRSSTSSLTRLMASGYALEGDDFRSTTSLVCPTAPEVETNPKIATANTPRKTDKLLPRVTDKL